MKRIVINFVSLVIIVSGSLILSSPTNGMFLFPNEQIEEETRCGSCVTTDPNKCCKTKIFKRCEIYLCD